MKKLKETQSYYGYCVKCGSKIICDVDIDKCLSTYEEFIKNETLTLEIVKEIKGETYDINDHETYLDVERV